MTDDLGRTLVDGSPIEPAGGGDNGGELRPSLVELAGRSIGRQYFLTGEPCTIGRGTDIELTVTDARASRRHAVIEPVPGTVGQVHYVIRDLESRNGTYVNGQRITTAPLNDGDKIQIGYCIFKYALKDTVELAFEDKIYKLATTDPLTGLHTRDYFFKEFAQLVNHCDRYGRPMSVVMIDLDDFKSVNDTHGHIAGDRVLEAVGKLLLEVLRNEDVAGRYGGEEFIALMPETAADAAQFPAERFGKLLARHTIAIPNGPKLHVTASIGIAGFPEHGKTMDVLVEAADKALYAAKKAGKNCVVVASSKTATLERRRPAADDPPDLPPAEPQAIPASDGDEDPFD